MSFVRAVYRLSFIGFLEPLPPFRLVHLLLAVDHPHDEGGKARACSRSVPALSPGRGSPRHTKPVGAQSVGADHRHAAVIGQGHAGVRVDQVRVARAVDDRVLPQVAGGGQRDTGEPRYSRGGLCASGGAMPIRQPGFSGGGSPKPRLPPASTNIRVMPCARSTAIASSTAYPLAIPPRSKRMFGFSSSTACCWVEPDKPIADPRKGVLDRLGRGEFFRLPGTAPEVNHRADRRVERPLRPLAQVAGRGRSTRHRSSLTRTAFPPPEVSQRRRSSLCGS